MENKPREALKYLKPAFKKTSDKSPRESIGALIFQAYLARENELRRKNMHSEAATVRQQAREYQPPASEISENDLVVLAGQYETGQAFAVYLEYLTSRPPSPVVETILAERLLAEDCWKSVETIPSSTPLAADAPVARQALPLMNQGRWEEAARILRAIPRSSPFAPLRLFCRILSAFYADNTREMKKAFSLLPDESLFKTIAGGVLHDAGVDADIDINTEGISAIRQLVWEGPLDIMSRTQGLNETTKASPDSELAGAVSAFAEAIYPDHPEFAKFIVLECLWNSDPSWNWNRKLLSVGRTLLPDRFDLFQAKTAFLDMPYELQPIENYLQLLDKEFPVPQEKSLAESQVLHYAVKSLYNDVGGSFFIDYGPDTGPGGLMNNILAIALRGLQADPQNMELYQDVLSFPVKSREGKKRKEKLLAFMVENRPEDPGPCLELAYLYLGKGAYRKAENVLTTALQRAPEDERIKEAQVIALLMSAVRNFNNRKPHLVKQDMEKAEALDSLECALLTAEKKYLFELLDRPDIPEKVIQMDLDDRTVFERLRLISFLLSDLEQYEHFNATHLAKKIRSIFVRTLDRDISRLASAEISQLLLPLPFHWRLLIPVENFCDLFVFQSEKVLPKLDNADLLYLIEQTITPDLIDVFGDHLHRLMENGSEEARNPVDFLLEFYTEVLNQVKERNWQWEDLENIVATAPEQIRENLRSGARRLAPRMPWPMNRALSQFDFRYPETSGEAFPEDLFFYDEDDKKDMLSFGDPLDLDAPADQIRSIFEIIKQSGSDSPLYTETVMLLNECLEMVRHSVGSDEIRGASPTVIRRYTREAMSVLPELERMLLLLKCGYDMEGVKPLNRELKMMINMIDI